MISRLKNYLCLLLFIFFVFFNCSKSNVKPPDIEILSDITKLSLYQGEKAVLPLKIRNNTSTTIDPRNITYLSYHLYSSKGKLIKYNNRRFKIPVVLWKQKTVSFNLPVFFSFPTAGQYKIKLDLVKEGYFWGSEKGWRIPTINLTLHDLYSTSFKKKYMTTMIDTGNDILNKEQFLLRLTLKNSELLKNGRLFGFSAGSDYPMIWIRDTATFISLALNYYPLKSLSDMVELFYLHQYPSGEIPGHISPAGIIGKNTIETDQESSLVLASYPIYQKNPLWIKKKSTESGSLNVWKEH